MEAGRPCRKFAVLFSVRVWSSAAKMSQVAAMAAARILNFDILNLFLISERMAMMRAMSARVVKEVMK